MKTEYAPGDRAMHDQHGEVEVIRSGERSSGRGYLVRAVHPNENTGHWFHDGKPMKRRADPFWAPWYMLAER